MTTVFVTEVGEVTPDRKCKCGDAAELHKVINGDQVDGDGKCVCGDAAELHKVIRAHPLDTEEYYDKCTVQGCQCLCFEEADA